jgi:hypothetical protein
LELELARHEWQLLQGVAGDARSLEPALRDLGRADDRATAVEAARRVERVVFAQGLLCEASAAAASALVHCLRRRREHTEDLILCILSDLSAAAPDEHDPEVYGRITTEQCLDEIRLGFPAYVEILETGNNIDSRTASIDLILACGISDAKLKERCLYFLRKAQYLEGLEMYGAVIQASIDDLAGHEGHRN